MEDKLDELSRACTWAGRGGDEEAESGRRRRERPRREETRTGGSVCTGGSCIYGSTGAQLTLSIGQRAT